MRSLAQPATLKAAAMASAVTAAAGYPQLAIWIDRPGSAPALCFMLFATGIFLWSFVFAWHENGSGRRIFFPGFHPSLWLAATLLGLAGAFVLHRFMDPAMREFHLATFPTNLKEWLAITLFTISFEQLFVCFAPFAFFIRLFRKRKLAAAQTVLFGVFIVILKLSQTHDPIPFSLDVQLVILRMVSFSITVFLYLRGGVFAVMWWILLLQTRHLPGLL